MLLSLVIFFLLSFAAMWGYDKFFGGCGCKDKV